MPQALQPWEGGSRQTKLLHHGLRPLLCLPSSFPGGHPSGRCSGLALKAGSWGALALRMPFISQAHKGGYRCVLQHHKHTGEEGTSHRRTGAECRQKATRLPPNRQSPLSGDRGQSKGTVVLGLLERPL